MKHYLLISLIMDKIVPLNTNKNYLIFCFEILFYFWALFLFAYEFKCEMTWEIMKNKPTQAVS